MRQRVPLLSVLLVLVLAVGVSVASRNSSGTYTLPSGNPVVSGTTVTSTWANNTLNDLGTEITNSLDRGGRGAMTAPLSLAAGTNSAPGLTFSAETNSGLYRAASHDIRMSVNGNFVQLWNSAGTTIGTALEADGFSTFNDVVSINGSSGASALTIVAGGGGANGIKLTSIGTGNGIDSTGGSSSGTGVIGKGGNPNGIGVAGVGAGSGAGVTATATSGPGISASSTSGSGGSFTGGGSSSGITATASGVAGAVVANNTGTGPGLSATSSGGVGISVTGGSAFPGLTVTGGASSTFAVQVNGGATNGGGITSLGAGTGIGGQFSNGTAATGGTRRDAVKFTNGDLDLSAVAIPSAGTAITNRVTNKNVAKVWCTATLANGGGHTINDGFGCTSASGASSVTFTFAQACSSTSYAAVATLTGAAPNWVFPLVTAKTTTSVTVGLYDANAAHQFTGSSTPAWGSTILDLVVFCAQ